MVDFINYLVKITMLLAGRFIHFRNKLNLM
jgi:hypothetical protein